MSMNGTVKFVNYGRQMSGDSPLESFDMHLITAALKRSMTTIGQ